MTYDNTNIFAKILRGELPAHKIHEDADTFAFMDIMPRGDGHCLVIPKKPSRNILDADPDSLAAVMRTTQKLSRAVMKAFPRPGRDGAAVQRAGRRPGRVPSPCPRPAALRRRAAEAARRPDGEAGGACRQRGEDQGGAVELAEERLHVPGFVWWANRQISRQKPGHKLASATRCRQARAFQQKIGPKPAAAAPRRSARAVSASAPLGKMIEIADDGRHQRGRHGADQHQRVGIFGDASAEIDAEKAPEVGRKPSGDQDEQERPPPGVDCVEGHGRALRARQAMQA